MPAENPTPLAVDGLVQNPTPATFEEMVTHVVTLRNSGVKQSNIVVEVLSKFASPHETLPRERLIDILSNVYPWEENASALTSILIYAARGDGNNIVSVKNSENKKRISYYLDSTNPLEKKTRRPKNIQTNDPNNDPTKFAFPDIPQPTSAIQLQPGFPVFTAPEKKLPKQEKSYECPIPPSGQGREAYIQQAINDLIPTDKAAADAILTRWKDNPISVSEWLNEINKNRSSDKRLTGLYLDTLVKNLEKECGMAFGFTKEDDDVFVYRKA